MPAELLDGVRIVALDAVGTLIYPAQSVAETYVEVAASFGIQRDRDAIACRFRDALTAEGAASRLETSEVLERQWWRRLVAGVLEIPLAQVEPIFETLWNYYGRPESWRVYEEVAEVAAHLSTMDLPWVIASNFDSRLRTICEASPILSCAKHVFLSSEVLWRKPAPRFYGLVTERLGVSPNEILMIGDHLECDVEAPRRAGWRALFLDRRSAVLEGGEKIAKLMELFD